MKTIFPLLLCCLCMAMSACLGTNKTTSNKYVSAAPTTSDMELTTISTDPTYGFTEKNPIKVGGIMEGPTNEQNFLNALAGPNGEEIRYSRTGSCCAFKTPNGLMGGGMLDRYEVKWKGQKEPLYLFFNMYDFEALKAPMGFTIR